MIHQLTEVNISDKITEMPFFLKWFQCSASLPVFSFHPGQVLLPLLTAKEEYTMLCDEAETSDRYLLKLPGNL